MAEGTEKDNGDYLGYGVYADTLWNRVQAALDKDLGSGKTLGDDPLVVGIFGEWGAGKSTLLKLTLDRASDYEAQRARNRRGVDGGFGDAGFGLTVPVLFQPWKYEHEPHLLVPLLLHIIQALRDIIPKAQTLSEKTAQVADAVWSSSIETLPDLVENFEAVYKATVADLAVADPVTAAGVSIGFKTAGWLAKLLKRPDDADWLRDFKFSTEGRFYYNFHNVLCALTRPGKRVEALGKLKLNQNARINFVIFIDDLDRCLPEKAVETLELIKTVFNLESFAFVLALDEEVVERGIGHRYKDYALQNKKPEMPITGFEYLEKIVHLPFRLPLLTKEQGLQFLACHEAALLEEQARRRWPGQGSTQQADARSRWMAQRRWFLLDGGRDAVWGPVRERGAAGSDAGSLPVSAEHGAAQVGVQHRLNLALLVLDSFNAHVPRKLIRVVELFQQVQDVLESMKPPRQLALGGEYDPRSVIALLLLQLFQPDLYRSLRRSADTFELFFDAFKPVESSEPTRQERVRRQLSATTADADLLHWAVYFLDDQPPGTLRAAQQRIPRLDVAERHATQHKRLPLVERLLEHRSIQRHPFDPLKLMQLLEQSARADKIPLRLNGNLFALLAREAVESLQMPREVVETIAATAQTGVSKGTTGGRQDLGPLAAGEGARLGADLTTAPASTRQRHAHVVEAPDVNALFLALVAPDEATQKTVAQVAGLAAGEALGPRSAQALIAQVEREFLRAALDRGNDDRDLVGRRLRLAKGLNYLAPHLVHDDARAFWNLTGLPVPQWEPAEAHPDTTTLKDSALRANLYVALGLDQRFDPSLFYLPKNQYPEHDNQKEPLPGFVWVQKERGDFQPTQGNKVSLAPFLMARYLTTVDQFAAFMEDGGYGTVGGEKPDWWDTQGWAWVSGEWDRHPTTPKWLKERLGQRPVEERQAPALWAQQRPWGSRPVCGVNWFEARAYARWLNRHEAFRLRLNAVNLGNARVELPIEAQWERAARASGFGSPPDGREYVWNDDKAEVALRANILESGLHEASPVGLFPCSPLGICDLNGDLWEWQDNLHADKAPHPAGQRIRQLQSPAAGSPDSSDWLVMGEEPSDSATPALRGGAWSGTAEYARASVRSRSRPGGWDDFVGFRVVLSLAE
ncbi:MAG: SUMF1/EgtB/PvdO family nonheme iron enzyme [Hydrogenophaga sp.]|nr:SUMF1/EgtB/PvdO family nonheme iron enzyme [Hydrogenophaga sp.]